ncbi:hypothetical protein IFM89_030964 [Coptis chinensis]|uniref:Cyclic nucleotide-binding domain-containing protein n=1 Tax=Coptis chinensis TaxID=261450 RepID=A0A835J1B7_9MAGN|nr:hypothetical protein IFM89_030964 [Coptis chinensis]
MVVYVFPKITPTVDKESPKSLARENNKKRKNKNRQKTTKTPSFQLSLRVSALSQISPSRVHHFGQGCSISVAVLVTSKKSPFSIDLGGEGDCFYVVGSGEFEVLATQEEKNEEVPWFTQLYTTEKLSRLFGS